MKEDENWEEQQANAGMWLPKEKGQTLSGEVTEVREGAYGKQITIRDAEGNTVTTPSHKALQMRLGNITIGDQIKITYLGTDLPRVKGYAPTRLYQVLKKKPYTEEEIKDEN